MGIDGLAQIALDDVSFLGNIVGSIGIGLALIVGCIFGYKKNIDRIK